MFSRKDFLKTGLLSLLPAGMILRKDRTFSYSSSGKPVVIATWKTAINATDRAWEVLKRNGYALDAVEKGVMVEEANPDNMTVGIGAHPDRDGNITLDACVMDENGECGAVAFLQNIKHPVQVARKVMTETPHWMLAGEGAFQFAIDQGFEAEDLMTPKAQKAWERWLVKSEYKPIINIENHDTIGMLALDAEGKLCGACTTSGAAYKMHGRVGDSPIIGAGLFIDPKIGGAVATGLGEEVVKTAGSHLIVEKMREGYGPEEACKIAVERIIERDPGNQKGVQVAYIALRNDGEAGGYSIRKGFDYVINRGSGSVITRAEHLIKA